MNDDSAHFPFAITLLEKSDARTAFSSGNLALDTYLQKQARQDIDKRVAATFVLKDTETGAIAGFYSLAATSVPLDQFPPEISRKFPKYPSVPATLLGRLAVDARFRGKGLGELLLVDALRRALEHSNQIASAAVIVDAKDDLARNFYLKQKFIELLDQPMRLFLPMKTIEQLGIL